MSDEWLDFIAKCRAGETHPYDIVEMCIRDRAYSQKGKVSNLKEMNETFNYLRKNGIYTLEDLESHVNEHSAATELSLIHI